MESTYAQHWLNRKHERDDRFNQEAFFSCSTSKSGRHFCQHSRESRFSLEEKHLWHSRLITAAMKLLRVHSRRDGNRISPAFVHSFRTALCLQGNFILRLFLHVYTHTNTVILLLVLDHVLQTKGGRGRSGIREIFHQRLMEREDCLCSTMDRLQTAGVNVQ